MGGSRGGENKKTDHQGQNQLWVRPVSQIQLVVIQLVWIFTFVACGRKSEKENFLIHESYMEFGVQCLPIELPWKQPHSSCVLYNRACAAHQTWVVVAEVTGHTNIWSFTEKVCWPLDLSMFRTLFSWEFHTNTVFPSFPSFQLHLSPLTSITSLIISVLLFYTHTLHMESREHCSYVHEWSLGVR